MTRRSSSWRATWRCTSRSTCWRRTLEGIRQRGEATSRKQLAIAGNDLTALGVAAGPKMGAILDRLLHDVVDNPALNTREQLLALAEKLK